MLLPFVPLRRRNPNGLRLAFPSALCLAAGVWLVPPADRTALAASLLPVGLVTSMHLLTFGHSRYHLPLIPVLLVFAAAAATSRLRLQVGIGSTPSERL